MVAILQLKASKLIVYFVSFTVVIFTILNTMLFSCANWFDTLHFGEFCGYDGKLSKRFRCYSNGRDNIHLGAVGIQVLIGKIKHAFSFRDNRSYAGAVRTT